MKKNLKQLLNHTCYILFFFLFPFYIFGQENLILNGDFEEYWQCPDDATQIERCRFVYNPMAMANGTGSTSDYFNTCANNGNSIVQIPQTFEGYQFPFSGYGMVGILSQDPSTLDDCYREYVQLSFSEPLFCGSRYRFQGYFNFADVTRYSLKGLGFYFTKGQLNEESEYLFVNYTPQVVDYSIISDTSSWTKITFEFVADEPYNFVSIGNLRATSLSDYIDVNPTALDQALSSYLFIDDVSLLLSSSDDIVTPNVFTPNEDGINDLFTLSEVSHIEEVRIFNRWGNEVALLHYPFSWNGSSENDRKMEDGVYYYIATSKKECNSNVQQGMIQLFR